MSRRFLRGYLVAATVVTCSLAISGCGQIAPPSGPAESRPAVTRPAAPSTGDPGNMDRGDPTSTPTAPAQKAGQAITKAPASKTGLVIAMPSDISKLDPHLSTSFQDIAVSFNLFDTLTARDPALNLIPRLATEWKTTGDRVWEFKLRPYVTFHNGAPLTSTDVKFSIERTYDPNAKTLVATVFTTVERIETPDALTVVFYTKQPDPLLPARLAFYGGQIIPKAYFEKVGPDQFNARPIGSGPVKFVEWVKDSHLALEANTEYWGGAPDFDQVTFKPIPENQPRLAALLSGQADLALKLIPDQVDQLTNNEKVRVEGAAYAGL